MSKLIVKEEVAMNRSEKEVYRMLRTNIEFTGVENKVIAITSCFQNDGKSTVAYNLAVMLAESGKRTLLIDADMRNSVYHLRHSVDKSLQGLSHILSGQCGINDVLNKTDKDNFYLMPSGVVPSNPTELLGNSRFVRMIDALREAFEYVIIDTPPLGLVIDAAVISKVCDGSVLVLVANKTSRSDAVAVVEQLRMANPNILGTVLNKVKDSGNKGYGKRYGGYYGSYYGQYGGIEEKEEE